jgi:hypothetical protein
VGTWERSAAAFAVDDTMSLKGWDVFRLEPISPDNGARTIVDYAGSELVKSSKTLGELRKGLEQEPKPDQ